MGYLQKHDAVLGNKRRPLDLLVLYHPDQVQDGRSAERRRPDEQLVDDAAQRPQVRVVVVGMLFDEFWRHVKGRALYGSEDVGARAHAAGKPEVAELRLVAGVQEDVLGFQIPKTETTTLAWFIITNHLLV